MTEKRLSQYRCRWCDGEVVRPRRTWCSDACVLEFTRRHHQAAFRSFVWDNSSGHCAECRIDLKALENLLASLDYLVRGELRRLLGFSGHGFNDLWEADHILPQRLGGAELDPKRNGRVLCRRCHTKKTQQDVIAIKQFDLALKESA